MQFRQIQATLHSWLGIVVLWSVFLIFFTGSIAYFRIYSVIFLALSLYLNCLDNGFSVGIMTWIFLVEPYRVCRRLNILRDYSDEKTNLYPRN